MLKVLVNLLLLASFAMAKIKYDQSQTGDYNVHFDLKNIEIVAILEDSSFSNNEYDYDYGEMTLKPSSSTDGTNDTAPVKPTHHEEPTTNHSIVSDISSTTNPTISVIPSTTTSSKPKRRCGAGFFRDVNGRCRRQRKPYIKK